MSASSITPQIRTVDMASSILFYTEKLGFTVAFNYQDFYVGLALGSHQIHLKLVDEPDPSIPYVELGGHLHLYISVDDIADLSEKLKTRGVTLVKDVHETPWGTREIVIHDDQGHTLYFGASL